MRHWRRAAALLLTLCMAASLLAGCGGDPNDEVKVSVVMTGGVAQNQGVVKALQDELGHEIHTSPLTQYNGALGAALFAFDKVNK